MSKLRCIQKVLATLSGILCLTSFQVGTSNIAWAAAEPPVLRIPLETEPESLDWSRAQSPVARFLSSFLMRGLLHYSGDGSLVCDLCRQFSVSKDRKSYRFELLPDLKWSDGHPLEAKQWVDAWDRLKKISPQEELLQALESYRAESSSVLVLTLKQPSVLFQHWLTLSQAFPIRKEFARDLTGRAEMMATQATLGPYILAEWKAGERLVLEGNPEYSGLRPVYRVDFLVGTHAHALDLFGRGKLDLVSNPTTEDLIRLNGRTVKVSPYWATRVLLFRMDRSRGTSELDQGSSLRKAILLSLDRATLPSRLKNGERPSAGLVPPGLMGFRALPWIGRDLARARAEWDRGHPGKTNGQPVRLRILVQPRGVDRDVVAWLKEQTQTLPIQWVPMELSASLIEKKLKTSDWDLSLQTVVFPVASPLEVLRRFRTQDPRNVGHWTSVGFDALLAQLFEGSSTAESPASLLDEATQILETQDPAVIPLSHPSQPFVLGPRVKDFSITPYGDPDLIRIQL